jgi:hypothetical protein
MLLSVIFLFTLSCLYVKRSNLDKKNTVCDSFENKTCTTSDPNGNQSTMNNASDELHVFDAVDNAHNMNPSRFVRPSMINPQRFSMRSINQAHVISAKNYEFFKTRRYSCFPVSGPGIASDFSHPVNLNSNMGKNLPPQLPQWPSFLDSQRRMWVSTNQIAKFTTSSSRASSRSSKAFINQAPI